MTQYTWSHAEIDFGPECLVEWDRLAMPFQVHLRPRRDPEGVMMRVPGKTFEISDLMHSIVCDAGSGPYVLWADEEGCGERLRYLGAKACRCMKWIGDDAWHPRVTRTEEDWARLVLQSRRAKYPLGLALPADFNTRRHGFPWELLVRAETA